MSLSYCLNIAVLALDLTRLFIYSWVSAYFSRNIDCILIDIQSALEWVCCSPLNILCLHERQWTSIFGHVVLKWIVKLVKVILLAKQSQLNGHANCCYSHVRFVVFFWLSADFNEKNGELMFFGEHPALEFLVLIFSATNSLSCATILCLLRGASSKSESSLSWSCAYCRGYGMVFVTLSRKSKLT